jgi:hypothetical protein
MEKYSLFSGKSDTGSPLIHRVEPGSTYGLGETDGLTKTASGEHLPGVIELIESIQAQPGRLYLVNSALGAGEYVGFNLRGDWFTEEGLRRTPPGFEDIPVWDIDARRRAANQTEALPRWGSLTWGYPTFYNAHRFRHHVNKDPNKAYGFILGAFWDDRMKRVILVSELIRDMCAKMGALDLYQRIENGEFPDSSMGSKVPYDRCSICDHHARTPLEYCKHVQRGAAPPYGMKAMLPDGRVCGVYNDYPRFFDDSFVFVGAERSAKVMSNVTDRIAGQSAYTQKIYPFMPRVVKVASAEEEMPAPASAPMPDFVLEEKLTRVLQTIPASTPLEREALRYFMQERLAEERLVQGTMSPAELQMWRDISVQTFQRRYGVSPQQITHLKQIFNDRANELMGIKTAAFSKVAEMLKRIPAPSASQMSIVRKEEMCLPEIPRDVLDRMAENPGPNLRAAARLGIVARPHEFQRIILLKKDRGLADRLFDNRQVFAPRPIRMSSSPFDAASFVPRGAMESMIDALSPMLGNRSFAPSAIKIRIIRATPMDKIGSFEHVDGLEEIGDLYNAYRLGIVEKKPDLTAISLPNVFSDDIVQDAKTAEDSVELSNIMLHVAYWPGLTLGLGQPAEGDSPEDAPRSYHDQSQNYESTHVTP